MPRILARRACALVPARSAKVSVDAEVELNLGVSGHFLRVQLNVRIPGLERNLAEELVDQAEQLCPYSKATRGNIEVRVTLV